MQHDADAIIIPTQVSLSDSSKQVLSSKQGRGSSSSSSSSIISRSAPSNSFFNSLLLKSVHLQEDARFAHGRAVPIVQ